MSCYKFTKCCCYTFTKYRTSFLEADSFLLLWYNIFLWGVYCFVSTVSVLDWLIWGEKISKCVSLSTFICREIPGKVPGEGPIPHLLPSWWRQSYPVSIVHTRPFFGNFLFILLTGSSGLIERNYCFHFLSVVNRKVAFRRIQVLWSEDLSLLVAAFSLVQSKVHSATFPPHPTSDVWASCPIFPCSK